MKRAVGATIVVAIALFSTRAGAEDLRLVVTGEPNAVSAMDDALSTAPVAGWTVVSASGFDAALKQAGQSQTIAAAWRKPKDRDELLAHAETALASDHDRAVLLVRLEKTAKGRKFYLVLVDAKGAPPVESEVTLGAANAPADREKLRAPIANELTRIALRDPPPAPVNAPGPLPTTDRAATTEAPPPETRPVGDPARAIFDVSVGIVLGSRHFLYYDGLTPNLRPYDVDAAPALGFAATVHPLGFLRTPVVSDIGITADFATAVGLDSATKSGQPLGTAWTRFDVGGRYRIRLGALGVVGVGVSYGVERFEFTESTLLAPELPSMAYGFVRPRVDGRVRAGPVAFTAAFAYLHIVSNGAVGLRMRGTENAGIEMGLGMAVPFAKVLEARLSGTYTRFFYSFDPAVGDAYVAGGALDHFLRGELALAVVY